MFSRGDVITMRFGGMRAQIIFSNTNKRQMDVTFVILNSVLFGLSFIIFFGYHLYLVWSVRNHPEKTVFGLTSSAR